MSAPRILAIMGSGETAPTMAKVHRALFDRLGGSATGAILDTPYGFQENADELSERTVEYFRVSVGRDVAVASYRSRDVDALTAATALARVQEAPYLMAGPGSPSYALRQWAGGPIPAALADKLAQGGIVTLASAAALTLGVVTIPVYEIYKVGEDPRWLEGLDLLGTATGLRAAVVPHYDNAEGGTHDTRFCYMGERRLHILERALPEGAFILGIDSHTALVLDLERGRAAVSGLGGVTVRAAGRSGTLPSGSDVPIARFADLARDLARGDATGGNGSPATNAAEGAGGRAGTAGRRPGPVRDEAAELEGAFVHALDADDVSAAVAALLDLDEAIEARIRHGEDSPELDNATGTFRALIARLGERAQAGTLDLTAELAPFVTALLDVRAHARAARDWETADLIRDRLVAAGIEVHDEPEASSWLMSETRSR